MSFFLKLVRLFPFSVKQGMYIIGDYIYIYTYMSVYIFICVYSKCPIVLKHCTTNFYSKRFKQLKDFGDPTEAKVCHVKYTGIYKFSVTIMNRFIE